MRYTRCKDVACSTFNVELAVNQIQGHILMDKSSDTSPCCSSAADVRSGASNRDSQYYFDDGLTVFAVENHLFRVHRYFLTRDSEFFRGLFTCPPPPGEVAEGQSDEKPIILEGVKESEFRCLMRFFYDGMYTPAVVSLDDWIALLSISTRYVFDRIREMAIQEISTKVLDPIKKIILANKYDIPQWLPPAFVDLCKRPESLSESEAETLGLKTIVRVARARESVRDKGYVTWTPRSYFPHDRVYSFNERGVLSVINEVWPEYAGAIVPA
ncbi:unnamed protein product [Somion occarium]|uniref:BTB domain-containing protein n=1 Tax=Somion occarium TaxID=3059160 RepID=A0ABP1DQR7_9APHY